MGILDGDICLADRQEEIYDGNIVVAFVNGPLTVKTPNTQHPTPNTQKAVLSMRISRSFYQRKPFFLGE